MTQEELDAKGYDLAVRTIRLQTWHRGQSKWWNDLIERGQAHADASEAAGQEGDIEKAYAALMELEPIVAAMEARRALIDYVLTRAAENVAGEPTQEG